MSSLGEALIARTRGFAVRVIRFVRRVQGDAVTQLVLRQLTRSATGVAANYRATRHARSRAEFIAKFGIVVEEADETEHWLQILIEADLIASEDAQSELSSLMDEAQQLRAIFVKAATTARANRASRQT